MSTDAKYLLVYDMLPYASPSPMEKDIAYLEEKYGGKIIHLEGYTYFWDKPKHTLLEEEIEKLHADQVIERQDDLLWEIRK